MGNEANRKRFLFFKLDSCWPWRTRLILVNKSTGRWHRSYHIDLKNKSKVIIFIFFCLHKDKGIFRIGIEHILILLILLVRRKVFIKCYFCDVSCHLCVISMIKWPMLSFESDDPSEMRTCCSLGERRRAWIFVDQKSRKRERERWPNN
jgi:hypothetical protein